MPQTATYPLIVTVEPPGGGGGGTPSDFATDLATDAFLGVGILHPFRRDLKSDVANGTGEQLISSNIREILGTKAGHKGRPGELRWRSRFGSLLHLLRHRNQRDFQELVRIYVVEPVRRWEPRARIKSVRLDRIARGGALTVRYDIVDASAGQRIVQADVLVNLPISQFA